MYGSALEVDRFVVKLYKLSKTEEVSILCLWNTEMVRDSLMVVLRVLFREQLDGDLNKMLWYILFMKVLAVLEKEEEVFSVIEKEEISEVFSGPS